MPTGDSWVNIALKRFLSWNRMTSNFLDYLKEQFTDLGTRIFPASGVFTYPVTITPAVGTFTLTPDPIECWDGDGHTLLLSGDELVDIPFENTEDDCYWIGAQYIEVPDGVYSNPRTGIVEYDKWQEAVGMRGNPDEVVDDGDGTITLTVNSVTQSGVDNSGRTVKVWLVNPMSNQEATAIETCSITYDAPDNKIATVAKLGQGDISIDPNDYQVALEGVIVHNDGPAPTANPFGDDVCVFGFIKGDPAAPTKIDEALQLDLSGGGGHTLQKAYDGLAGDGSGRTITVADQAVNLVQSNSFPRSYDIAHAVLRARKDDNTSTPEVFPAHDTKEQEIGIDAAMRLMAQASMLDRRNLLDVSGNDYLRAEEAAEITAADNHIQLTRGGDLNLDMPLANAHIWYDIDMVEVSGSALGNNGVYVIHDINLETELEVLELDGSTPTFAIEAGLTVKLYRPLIKIGNGYSVPITMYGVQDFARDQAIRPWMIVGIVPPTTEDEVLMLQLYRDDGAGGSNGYINVYANGDVEISGDFSTQGSISADLNIETQSDVVAEGNITATTGNIVASEGNVIATIGDIEASAGGLRGDSLRFNAWQDFYQIIPGVSGISSLNSSHMSSWESVPKYDEVSKNSMDYISGDVQGIVSYNLNEFIPDGTAITRIRALVTVGVVSHQITMMVHSQSHSFNPAAPMIGNNTIVSQVTRNVAGDFCFDMELDPAPIVDHASEFVLVSFMGNESGDKVYALQITYSTNKPGR